MPRREGADPHDPAEATRGGRGHGEGSPNFRRVKLANILKDCHFRWLGECCAPAVPTRTWNSKKSETVLHRCLDIGCSSRCLLQCESNRTQPGEEASEYELNVTQTVHFDATGKLHPVREITNLISNTTDDIVWFCRNKFCVLTFILTTSNRGS